MRHQQPSQTSRRIAPSLFSVMTAISALGSSLGCQDKPAPGAAPVTSALVAEAPASRAAVKLTIDTDKSAVGFLMDAPLEKIHGKAPGSVQGELFVDWENPPKSTGLLKIDLDTLVLYQSKRASESDAYGAETKNDLQNEHARAWLEIGKDVPAETREVNRWVEFRVTQLALIEPTDATKLSGPERLVRFSATGDLRVHGRAKPASAELEAKFFFNGETLVRTEFKTVKPVAVGLEDYDVRPREAFGKLAQKTLSVLAPKVAKEANVSFEVVATASAAPP